MPQAALPPADSLAPNHAALPLARKRRPFSRRSSALEAHARTPSLLAALRCAAAVTSGRRATGRRRIALCTAGPARRSSAVCMLQRRGRTAARNALLLAAPSLFIPPGRYYRTKRVRLSAPRTRWPGNSGRAVSGYPTLAAQRALPCSAARRAVAAVAAHPLERADDVVHVVRVAAEAVRRRHRDHPRAAVNASNSAAGVSIAEERPTTADAAPRGNTWRRRADCSETDVAPHQQAPRDAAMGFAHLVPRPHTPMRTSQPTSRKQRALTPARPPISAAPLAPHGRRVCGVCDGDDAVGTRVVRGIRGAYGRGAIERRLAVAALPTAALHARGMLRVCNRLRRVATGRCRAAAVVR